MKIKLFFVFGFLVLLCGCLEQGSSVQGGAEVPNTENSAMVFSNTTPLNEGPTTESIALPPVGNRSFKIENPYTGERFSVREIANESGIYIFFDDPLPKFSNETFADSYEARLYSKSRTDADHIVLPILDKNYSLSCLDYNIISRKSIVCLGQEKDYRMLYTFGCSKIVNASAKYSEYINTSNGAYGFSSYGGKKDNYDYAGICKVVSTYACASERLYRAGGSIYLPGGDILHIWTYEPSFDPCSSYIDVSVFSKEIFLENSSNVQLEWDASTRNQKLKSIFIPSSSYAYDLIVG